MPRPSASAAGSSGRHQGQPVDFVTIGNEMSVSVVDSVELANRLRPVLLLLNRQGKSQFVGLSVGGSGSTMPPR